MNDATLARYRAMVQVERRAPLQQPAAAHQSHPVRQGQRLALLVRHHDRGGAVLDQQVAHLRDQPRAGVVVQSGERFVEQQ